MNRAAIQVKYIKDLIIFLNKFIDNINKNQIIVDIVRIKNGFKTFDENNPRYTDIKLNVLITNKKYSIFIGFYEFV